MMQTTETAEVIRRFNQAFEEHNPALLDDLVAEDCVMESIQPAPNGTRYEGRELNLAFWRTMVEDRVNTFETEEAFIMGDRAISRWRYRFGNGESVRGVSITRVRNGQIVEALAYAKSPGETAPLPEVAS
jgi:ketosteroid isomerase-like protein